MNMKPSAIRAVLLNQFYTNYSETPVEYDNVQLSESDKKNPFVSFNIRFTNGMTIIKGEGSITRYSGVIFIDVRVPLLSSDIRAFEIADIVCEIMERKRLTYNDTSVTTDASEVSKPIKDNDEYFTLPISIPFRVT